MINKFRKKDDAGPIIHTLQASADGIAFTSIGSLLATDKPTGINNYLWDDLSPLSGTNYYRIKSVDRDGAFSYTKIVRINFTGLEASIRAYPVPAANEVQLTFPPSASAQIFTIFNNDGKIKDQIKVAKDVPSVTVAIGSYPAGVYFVRGQNGLNTKFIKL